MQIISRFPLLKYYALYVQPPEIQPILIHNMGFRIAASATANLFVESRDAINRQKIIDKHLMIEDT